MNAVDCVVVTVVRRILGTAETSLHLLKNTQDVSSLVRPDVARSLPDFLKNLVEQAVLQAHKIF